MKLPSEIFVSHRRVGMLSGHLLPENGAIRNSNTKKTKEHLLGPFLGAARLLDSRLPVQVVNPVDSLHLAVVDWYYLRSSD